VGLIRAPSSIRVPSLVDEEKQSFRPSYHFSAKAALSNVETTAVGHHCSCVLLSYTSHSMERAPLAAMAEYRSLRVVAVNVSSGSTAAIRQVPLWAGSRTLAPLTTPPLPPSRRVGRGLFALLEAACAARRGRGCRRGCRTTPVVLSAGSVRVDAAHENGAGA
jgi:hypothetical protein